MAHLHCLVVRLSARFRICKAGEYSFSLVAMDGKVCLVAMDGKVCLIAMTTRRVML